MQRKQAEVQGGFIGRLGGGRGLLLDAGLLRASWPRRCPCLGAESAMSALSRHPTLFWGSLLTYDGSCDLIQLQMISMPTLGDAVLLNAGQHPSQACGQCWRVVGQILFVSNSIWRPV